MEVTHNGQVAGLSSVSPVGTENGPSVDTGGNTVAMTDAMCSTCKQINTIMFSIKYS